MNVLIDSYGWIEYFCDGRLAHRYAAHIDKADKNQYFTPSVVIYEVYKRLKSSVGRDKAIEAHAYITHYTTVINLDEALALDAADISVAEELGMADAIIYATARRHKALIVTSDQHFKDKKNVEYIPTA
ncbi:MAG: type II toxin-antitoxin system VapC family toxin [Candidatus Altiarchaeota archaeon]